MLEHGQRRVEPFPPSPFPRSDARGAALRRAGQVAAKVPSLYSQSIDAIWNANQDFTWRTEGVASAPFHVDEDALSCKDASRFGVSKN